MHHQELGEKLSMSMACFELSLLRKTLCVRLEKLRWVTRACSWFLLSGQRYLVLGFDLAWFAVLSIKVRPSHVLIKCFILELIYIPCHEQCFLNQYMCSHMNIHRFHVKRYRNHNQERSTLACWGGCAEVWVQRWQEDLESMNVGLCFHIYMHHVLGAQWSQSWHQIPLGWSYRCLWASMSPGNWTHDLWKSSQYC